MVLSQFAPLTVSFQLRGMLPPPKLLRALKYLHSGIGGLSCPLLLNFFIDLCRSLSLKVEKLIKQHYSEQLEGLKWKLKERNRINQQLFW